MHWKAEVISLDTGLRMEGLLTSKLWDAMTDVLEFLVSQARCDLSRQFKPETLKARQEFSDRSTTDMTYASHLSASVFRQPEASSFNGSGDLTSHPHTV